MRRPSGALLIWVVLFGASWLGFTGECAAQGVETVGVRALGMGGAFVAVADDATATYWNPAGLATGALFSTVIEHTWQASGARDVPAFGEAQEGSATFIGIGAPPVGITYYHLRSTRVLGPDGGTAGGTILPGDRGFATSLVTDHAGVTFVQSIGQFLDVAGTVKYVHGRASIAPRDASFEGEQALDRAADLPSQGSSTVDFDLGALAQFGQVRAGLVVRNLREPSFDAPGGLGALRLDRQVRAGVAWQVPHASTLSCDVDLTRTETEAGVRRHVAVGGEHWLHSRLAVRAGLRVNTTGDALPAGSAGASVAVTPSIWLDAQVTRGGDAADRGWGIGARIGF
jgi:hypothetical protein